MLPLNTHEASDQQWMEVILRTRGKREKQEDEGKVEVMLSNSALRCSRQRINRKINETKKKKKNERNDKLVNRKSELR